VEKSKTTLLNLTGGRLTEIHLIKIVIFQLIESFNNESFIFYHLTKFFETFQLIESFINGILGFKKVLINCQNLQVIFWHLIEILIMSFGVILNFRSTAKICKLFFGS
jgi:hypothetical protein